MNSVAAASIGPLLLPQAEHKDIQYKYVVSICLLGAINVGKTTMTHRWMYPLAKPERFPPTLGMEFGFFDRVEDNVLSGSKLHYYVYDNQGVDKYDVGIALPLLMPSVRASDCVAFVCDIQSHQSILDCMELYKLFKNQNVDWSKKVIYMIANKCDSLVDTTVSSTEENEGKVILQRFLQNNKDCTLFEVCACHCGPQNNNMEPLLQHVTNSLHQKNALRERTDKELKVGMLPGYSRMRMASCYC